MVLSSLARAQITGALKKSNQRLAQLSKSLKQANAHIKDYDPRRDSSIYKKEIAPFQNGVYDKYLTTSQGTETGTSKVHGKNVAKGGNDKFNIRAIMKDIENGTLDYSEANDFLVKAAGIRLNPDGEVTNTGAGGISTVTEIKDEARNMFGDEYKSDELLQMYDDVEEFRESFQTDYEEYVKEFRLSGLEKDEDIRRLKKDFRSKNEYLDYDELVYIHKKMKDELNKASKPTKKYNGNGTGRKK